MADNVAVTPGAGATIATDEVVDGTLGTVQVQYVKLMDGTLDGTTKAAVSSAGLKVDLGADNDVTVTGTVDLGATDNAVLDAIQAAVELIDDAISGTEMQVDVVTSALPSGAATAAKQPALGTAGTPSADVISIQGVASMTAVKVDGSGVTQPVSGTVTASNAAGDVAHDGVDSGNPVKVGMRAIAHGSNPTAVAAADRTDWLANRAGVPWVIGGHPNVQCWTYLTTGAQTDDNVMAAVASGTKYVVTRVTITLDEAATVGVAVRLGFGTASVPTLPTSGSDAVAGILMYHPGLVPGSGVQIGDGSGILGVGGDGEELRITCEAPTSGTLVVSVSGYTIES